MTFIAEQQWERSADVRFGNIVQFDWRVRSIYDVHGILLPFA
jgi:hypothetical protein